MCALSLVLVDVPICSTIICVSKNKLFPYDSNWWPRRISVLNQLSADWINCLIWSPLNWSQAKNKERMQSLVLLFAVVSYFLLNLGSSGVAGLSLAFPPPTCQFGPCEVISQFPLLYFFCVNGFLGPFKVQSVQRVFKVAKEWNTERVLLNIPAAVKMNLLISNYKVS